MFPDAHRINLNVQTVVDDILILLQRLYVCKHIQWSIQSIENEIVIIHQLSHLTFSRD